MKQTVIYSVEDDVSIATIINKTLTKDGHYVKSFYDAESFLEAYKQEKPDILLLDLMLPKMQGMELLDLLRNTYNDSDLVVIIVSAKEGIEDRIIGLDNGADDYIIKPFDLSELRSRVNAHIRRNENSKSIIKIGKYFFNTTKEEVSKVGKIIELTRIEYNILMKLVLSRGQIISRDELFKLVNIKDGGYNSRTVDNHIKKIRTKLNDNGNFIVSIYGKGYIIY